MPSSALLYRDGDPLRDVPTLRMISADPDELRGRADELTARLAGIGAETVASSSFAGAGANPARSLRSFATALPGGDCICLAVLESPLRFTRWHHRWLSPLLQLRAG